MGEPHRFREIAGRLAQTALFRGLKDETLLAIASRATLRSLRRSQTLWKQGAHAYELAYVWEGQLDVVRRVGGNVMFRAVKQNEIIGVSNAMGLTPCTVDVVAGQPTRVCCSSRASRSGSSCPSIPRSPSVRSTTWARSSVG